MEQGKYEPKWTEWLRHHFWVPMLCVILLPMVVEIFSPSLAKTMRDHNFVEIGLFSLFVFVLAVQIDRMEKKLDEILKKIDKQ